MNKTKMLNNIKNKYDEGVNIMQYLKGNNPATTEDIMISYDFQAGTYVDYYYDHLEFEKKHADRIIQYIKGLSGSIESIFDAGVGEATRLVPIINGLNNNLKFCGGADLSWSRIKTAQLFAERELSVDVHIQLFCGDIFSLPLLDNSIDLVMTMHALEPNGGHERELLKELYRITNKYMLLIEPDYSLASDEGKKRMDENGYIKNLRQHADSLGYRIILDEPFEVDTRHDTNPASIIIIEKDNTQDCPDNPMCDPLTGSPLRIIGDAYYADASMLSYPILNGVPCLMKDNAVVATRMIELIENRDGGCDE